MGYETKYSKDGVSTLFSLCSCNSEVLVIQYDHDANIADLCIYGSYYTYKMSLWQKIRYIWHIISYGYPYRDQIVIDKNCLKEIKNFLNETIS